MRGSAFTLSVVEEEQSTSQKPAHIISAMPKPAHIMSATPELAHVMSAKPKPDYEPDAELGPGLNTGGGFCCHGHGGHQ